MSPTARPPAIRVYLEAGRSRVFACAVDWPGWCRRAKSDEEALDVLAGYAPRYAAVAQRAGVAFPTSAGESFDIVERIPAPVGSSFSAVDFGALGAACALDSEPISAAQAKRLAVLVEASWQVLDDVVAQAPATLRKGPRGGGRDRDDVFGHVVRAEASYARKLGAKHREPSPDDPAAIAAIAAIRADIGSVLRAARGGDPVAANGWSARYAARRIAWHALDHAWEIEDKSEV